VHVLLQLLHFLEDPNVQRLFGHEEVVGFSVIQKEKGVFNLQLIACLTEVFEHIFPLVKAH
jgi:hypothetical protein